MKRQASAPTTGATISGSATMALKILLPREPAMERQRDGQPDDRFEHEARERRCRSVCQSAVWNSDEPAIRDVVVETPEVGRAAHRGVRPLRLSQTVQATG